MLEVRALINMVLGAFQNLTTHPSLDALAAYLFLTFIIFVGIPFGIGWLTKEKYLTPAFNWWLKWCVGFWLVLCVAFIAYPVHFIARAIEGAANQRWTYRDHLRGNILAFGANAAAWFVYWVARFFAELSGLAIANLLRGTRAAAPAANTHH